MADEDKELEYLRAKKILELRRRIVEAAKPKINPKETSSRDILVSRLVDRGLEVLETAERYYPDKTVLIVDKLAEAIKSGSITGLISGGELYWFFRQIGMRFQIPTSIHIEKHGKLVPLTERLKHED